MSVWCSLRMLTANQPASAMAWRVSLVLFRQTSSIGGSIDSDENALAVVPKSSSPTRVVMTVTPLANRPMTSRKTAASTCCELACAPVIQSSNQTPDRQADRRWRKLQAAGRARASVTRRTLPSAGQGRIGRGTFVALLLFPWVDVSAV